MKPTTVIKHKPYADGDTRGGKTSHYMYTLDFKEKLYNLTIDDCIFILDVFHKNISSLGGNKINAQEYDKVVDYGLWERGTDIMVSIILKKDDISKQQSFNITYDYETKHIRFDMGINNLLDHSGVIMIYEYFLQHQ